MKKTGNVTTAFNTLNQIVADHITSTVSKESALIQRQELGDQRLDLGVWWSPLLSFKGWCFGLGVDAERVALR